MARARSEKKRKPEPPATIRVLPIELKVGDRLTDERGEWEFAGPMHTSNFGKIVHAGFRLVTQPTIIEVRTGVAHERISVKRV